MTDPKTPLKLYNSLTRDLTELKPLHNNTVGLYTCGPTVYNYAHIGNLRTYIFEDILKRVLIYNGLSVNHVMNITDVGHLTDDADTGEDKMEKGSKREGKTAWDVAKFYEAAFVKDLAELNIIPANVLPRATEHIKEQIELIKTLEQKGFTYTTSDGVYFDTSKFPDYGKMANLKNQHLKEGARVDMGEKKNPTDFALWKFSAAGEKRQMEWPSPWGTGFPGWHIECSAMAVKYLGQPFDIHCGGIDHVPVHHTNEIAQSEAAYDKPLANIWMHGEFLLMGSDKMAKSGDNFVTLQKLKELGISPLAYRYLLLQTNYRKQMSFGPTKELAQAVVGLERLYAQARSLPKTIQDTTQLKNEFLKKINDDLDTPGAFALVWTAIKERTIDQATLLEFDKIFGLEIEKNLVEKETIVSDETKQLIKARDAARASKNFAESDRLRGELEALGYEVKDTKDGTQVNKK